LLHFWALSSLFPPQRGMPLMVYSVVQCTHYEARGLLTCLQYRKLIWYYSFVVSFVKRFFTKSPRFERAHRGFPLGGQGRRVLILEAGENLGLIE
ncbi:MAG: hypothetical protein MIO92_05510, partial [Methanosarcinaceae archaeon]|nr:hypothetical protein [Methanosarcinaceae archaeon]